MVSEAIYLVVIALVGGGWAAYERVTGQRRRLAAYERYRLRFPQDVSAATVGHLVGQLVPARRRWQRLGGVDVLGLEVVGTDTGLEHFIWLAPTRVEVVRGQLYAALPGLAMELATTPLPSVFTRAVELRTTHLQRPLRSNDPAAVARSLLAAMQPLRKGETLAAVWLVSKAAPRQPIPDLMPSKQKREGWLLEGLTQELQSREAVKAARQKQAEPLVWVTGRLGAIADDVERANQLVARLRGVLQAVSAPGARLVARRLPHAWVGRRLSAHAVPVTPFPALLNISELVSVMAWPIESPSVPGLELTLGRPWPAHPMIPTSGRRIGTATYPGRERLVAQPYDGADRHTLILGPTGTGKSVLLSRQIVGDINAPGRRAVVVMDWKEGLHRSVLGNFPVERDDDLIVLDVTSDRPIGFNPLQGADRHPEVVADALFVILRRLWGLEKAPRTSDLLFVSLLSLAHHRGATLIDLAPLVSSFEFRKRVIARHADDPVIGAFWSAFNAMSEGERGQVTAPLLTRVRQVLLRTNLRVILGQAEPKLNIGNAINSNKVLFVPLSAGLIGPESAALLGGLVMAELWTSAQARAGLPPERRKPASILVDEWQQAAAGSMTDMSEVFALSRGFNVAWTVANQTMSQLSPALREAVLANTRSKLLFNLSAGDAAVMAREIGHGVSAADIQGLGRHQVMASIAVGTEVAPPVTVRTELPPQGDRDVDALLAQSAARHGRDREEVEAEIRSRYQSPVHDLPDEPGVRRRQS